MKAFVLRSFGSADQLELREVDTPVPGPGEVLVRVRATSVQPYDWHTMRGEPYAARLLRGGPGFRRPRLAILGADIAGEVAAVGRDVTLFRPGDAVYAMPKGGGFAEYACVRESELAPKPGNLSFAQAAAVPMAANTALIGLRDQGRVQAGQRVLVNGASGGVGTFAVQLARAFGAQVTGVCGTRNLELVRSLGAHEVVDYTAADLMRTGRRYDLMLDIAGGRSGWAYRRVLTPAGTLVLVGGPPGRWVQPAGHVMAAMMAAPLMSARVALADVVACTENRQNLATLSGLIEDGRVSPVIDRSFPFAELPAAVRYQEQGHASGKVVVES